MVRISFSCDYENNFNDLYILGMFDFQYGPFENVSANAVGETTSETNPAQDNFRIFYDQLLIKEPSRVLDSYLKTPNMPLFLPPLLFTRLDQPTMYCFSSRFRMNQYVELEHNSQQHPYRKFLLISVFYSTNRLRSRNFTKFSGI